MQVKIANFHTVGVEQNLSYQFLQDVDRMVYLGRWTFGTPTEQGAFDPLPAFKTDPEDDADTLRDASTANGLILLQPAQLWEAFNDARGLTLDLMREVNRLRGKGYRHEPLRAATEKKVNDAFELLRKHGNNVLAIQDRVAKVRAAAAAQFPDFGESEAQSVMFDVAIVSRLVPPNDHERRRLAERDIPERFMDARLICALCRTPHVLHGIDPETMVALSAAYASRNRPRTIQVCDSMDEMVAQARAGMAAAVCAIAPIALITPTAAFARIKGPAGDWLAGARGQVETIPTSAAIIRHEKRMLDLPTLQDSKD